MSSSIIKSIISGIAISILVNAIYISTLFVDYEEKHFFIVVILAIALVFFALKNNTSTKKIVKYWGIMILSNIITEIALSAIGLTNYFYYVIHPDAVEVALGEGIILLVIYMLEITGVLIGLLLLILTNCIKHYWLRLKETTSKL